MTEREPKRIRRNVKDAQEVVTFRLPKDLLERLDERVEWEESSRTSVIRGALAVYFSLDRQILVPASTKTRELLGGLAERQNRPASAVAGELLERAVRGEGPQHQAYRVQMRVAALGPLQGRRDELAS